MKNEAMTNAICTTIKGSYMLTVMASCVYIYFRFGVPLLSRFGLPGHTMYALIFIGPILFLALAFFDKVIIKVFRDEG